MRSSNVTVQVGAQIEPVMWQRRRALESVLQLAIVGHVDHGKSTLIGRLLVETQTLPAAMLEEVNKVSRSLGKDAELAFVTDQLKEERDNAMTIETTQRRIRIGRRTVQIIDTPGHLEFVKQMLSGASQAEAAVLVVDAARGVEEQTRVHASLLKLLGIEQVIVAINKMDQIGYDRKRYERVSSEIRVLLQGLEISPRRFVPISALLAEHVLRRSARMKWAGVTLCSAIERLPLQRSGSRGPFRLPVQDVYDIDGKRIVVGRIVAGAVRPGQRIVMWPSKMPGTIASLEAFGQTKRRAEMEESIGLTLADSANHSIRRGDVLCDANDALRPTSTLTGQVFWLADRPLQVGGKARLRCTTQEADVTVEGIHRRTDATTLRCVEEQATALQHHELGVASLRSEHPLMLEPFRHRTELGRFTLELEDRIHGFGAVINAAG